MVKSPIKISILRQDRELHTTEEFIRFFLVFIRELGLRKKSIRGAINPFIQQFYFKFGDTYPPLNERKKTNSGAS